MLAGQIHAIGLSHSERERQGIAPILLMTTHSSLRKSGFTILESCLMLVLLTAFCMVTIAVIKRGQTSVPDADNPEWKKKGGDETMSTTLSMPASALLPDVLSEQTGLGSGSSARSQPAGNPPAK